MATGTTLYGLQKPTVGADADVWGSHLNNNLDDTEALLSAITTTGSANAYVLTTGLSLAAYVSGQSFLIKANFTNSGAATINVDGLGAKSLVKGASTALASGDITSGAMYRIAYDGTNFLVLNAGAGSYQPLDATLTALAALSWSSGNALVQFTAADTVSLTLTPSVTSLSTTGAVAAGGAVSGTTFTPSGSSPPTNGLYLPATNTLGWAINSAGEMQLTASALSPISSGGLALGTTSLMWAGAFLSASSALNWNNGDVTVTHSTNALAFAGASSGYSFDATVSVSQGAAATTPSATFVNTNDSSGVRVLRLEGDRATPANNDNIYGSFYISNLSGTQTEVARIRCLATDLTAGSEDARIDFLVAINGAMTATLVAAGTSLSPNTSDGMALGTTSQMWSDLFLASGAVLNFSNGGLLVTHDNTNDRLVLSAGSLKARPSISTDTGGTLTSASDNCIVDLATAPTINDGIHEAGSIIVLVNNTASSMTITQDTGMTLRLHGTSTTGNLTLAARGIATVQIDPVSNAEAIVLGDVS